MQTQNRTWPSLTAAAIVAVVSLVCRLLVANVFSLVAFGTATPLAVSWCPLVVPVAIVVFYQVKTRQRATNLFVTVALLPVAFVMVQALLALVRLHKQDTLGLVNEVTQWIVSSGLSACVVFLVLRRSNRSGTVDGSAPLSVDSNA